MRLLRSALRTVSRSLSPMLWYELFFKVLAAAILAPLVAALLAGFIRSTGSVSISNEAIAGFILSPRGLAALVVVGTVSFGIIFMELAGLMVISAETLRGEPGRPVAALRRVAGRFPRLLRLGLLQLVGFVLLATPFLIALWLVYRSLLSGSDINYYLAERPPEFWMALGIGALVSAVALVLLAALYVGWILALPIMLFEQSRPWTALRRSYRLVRQAWRSVAAALVGWLLLALLLGAAANAAFDVVSNGILDRIGDRTVYVLAAVALLIALYVVGAAVISAVAATVDAALIMQIYADLAGSPPEAAPAERRAAAAPRFASAAGLAWVSVLAILAVAAVTAVTILGQLRLDHRVAVTAHRGSSRAAPENTLSAIRQAIDDGADFAEIDVQLSADSVVVVLHDADFQRVAGVARSIADLTYEEIGALDVGSWFSPDFAGERAPTLQQAMDLARGRIKLNIELKVKGAPEGLVERVAELVERNDFTAECVITSLDEAAVRAMKLRSPELAVGAIVATAIGDASRLPVDLLSVSTQFVSRNRIRRAHRRDVEVHVWTVNDPQQMWDMIHLRVDNIITDEPTVLVAVLEESASLNNAQRVLLGFRSWLAQ